MAKENKVNVRASIINRMKETDTSTGQMAADLGVGFSSISRFLNGETKSLRIIDEVLEYLGLEICVA